MSIADSLPKIQYCVNIPHFVIQKFNLSAGWVASFPYLQNIMRKPMTDLECVCQKSFPFNSPNDKSENVKRN